MFFREAIENDIVNLTFMLEFYENFLSLRGAIRHIIFPWKILDRQTIPCSLNRNRKMAAALTRRNGKGYFRSACCRHCYKKYKT